LNRYGTFIQRHERETSQCIIPVYIMEYENYCHNQLITGICDRFLSQKSTTTPSSCLIKTLFVSLSVPPDSD
jgi:hypothetical protein